MKKYKLKNGLLVCNKVIIENKISFIKSITSTDEKEIIENFLNALNNIVTKYRTIPQVFCINRSDYFSFVLTRALKYKIDFKKALFSLNKWQIEDIFDKLNCFQNKKELFNYLELKPIKEDLILEEAKTSKENIKEYLINQLNIIENLGIVTSRLLNITYQNNLAPKIVVYIETEILKDKIEEFKNTYTFIEDEKIENYMKHNYNYSKIVSISICQLTDKLAEGAEENVV